QTVERSVLLGHAVPVEVVHAATARSAYARPVGAVERVVALTREQRVLPLEFAADVEVVAVFGEAADAPRGIDSVLVAAAMLGGAERAAQMDALNFFLSDDVDDARDRVCTVGRRRAVAQHFDTLDDGARNRVEVDEVALTVVRERVRREAHPVGDR